MKTVVMKFGGTSVATDDVRQKAIEHIADAVLQGYRVVVVVSAMGRRGEPYATDELLGIVENRPTIERELDILLSCGEAISSVVFAAQLREHGLDTTVLSGSQAGIVTDDRHGEARIQEVKTERLKQALADNRVVVVMGFQGQTESGDTTTLGRGGSDTTATAIGSALKSESVQIFSDVDGILTADPRLVGRARLLPELTYTEACALAWEGAKVIHPRAVEVAMQTNTPLYVRNTSTDDGGTQIGSSFGIVEDRQRCGGCVIGIAHEANRVQVNVDAAGDQQQAIFAAIATAGIQPGFSMSSPTQVSFTIDERDSKKVDGCLRKLGQNVQLVSACARVSVVGTKLDEIPCLMGKVLETLSLEKVQVLQSSDAQSMIRVLVRKADLDRAAQALHRALIEMDSEDSDDFPLALAATAAAAD